MQLRHDPENNIAYIRFQPKIKGVETIELSADIWVDIAPDGSLYGIELLNANEQLQAEDNGALFQFINAKTNSIEEIRTDG